MSWAARLANVAWLARGSRDVRRFHQSLADPQATQHMVLRSMLTQHAGCDYGQRHVFASIGTGAEYARQVPLVRYDGIAADVQRIARGEPDVLAVGRVSHLAPTSGSTGGRKLIPFNAALTQAFRAAVHPWVADLVRQRQKLLGGPAYWSISPLSEPERVQDSGVPMDFADDAEYLGRSQAWLVRHALAVPSAVRHATNVDAFRCLTLLALLRRRDLRLISIWHPSFLDLLVEAAPSAWQNLLAGIESGECPWSAALPVEYRTAFDGRPDRGRAAELRRMGPTNWPAWWPELQVVSCWGEQAAEPGWLAIRKRVPHILVQPKGLMATECVVTIPLGSAHVLAVTSHYFEFIDERGDIRLSHELERGNRYEVVVTNGGGLWRYQLGDVVECTGHVRRTPALRFLGRAGRVSDLRGEKLDEVFVAEVLRKLWHDRAAPSWAALRPRSAANLAGYDLLVAGDLDEMGDEIQLRAERALSANPHYALARRLGQLAPVRLMRVDPGVELERLRHSSSRLGDMKPTVLLP